MILPSLKPLTNELDLKLSFCNSKDQFTFKVIDAAILPNLLQFNRLCYNFIIIFILDGRNNQEAEEIR